MRRRGLLDRLRWHVITGADVDTSATGDTGAVNVYRGRWRRALLIEMPRDDLMSLCAITVYGEKAFGSDQVRCQQTNDRHGQCESYNGHPHRQHRAGSVMWLSQADRDTHAGPSLTSMAGSDPEFTGGVDPVAWVRWQRGCPHHDDPAVCAAEQLGADQ